MKTTRVLVVDDEPDITLMVKHGLEQEGGFEVREETDSTHVLDAAREFSPDVILLDVMMPVLDGGDVALCLAADPGLKNIPLLFLTATVMKDEVRNRGGKIGGHPFLAKPVEVDDLIRTIREQVGGADPGSC